MQLLLSMLMLLQCDPVKPLLANRLHHGSTSKDRVGLCVIQRRLFRFSRREVIS